MAIQHPPPNLLQPVQVVLLYFCYPPHPFQQILHFLRTKSLGWVGWPRGKSFICKSTVSLLVSPRYITQTVAREENPAGAGGSGSLTEK